MTPKDGGSDQAIPEQIAPYSTPTSPLPWTPQGIYIFDANGVIVLRCDYGGPVGLDVARANAIRVWRAVSNHDALLAALKEVLDAADESVESDDDVVSMLRYGKAVDEARAAIRKAEAHS